MVKLYRENGVYFVESRMELRFPIEVNGVEHVKKDSESFEDVDLVYAILERNGRVLIKDDDTFKRLSLGEFADILTGKNYILVEGLPTMVEIDDEDEILTPAHKEENVEVVEPEVQQPQIQQQEQQYNKKRNKERQYNNNEPKQQTNNVQQEQRGDVK